MRGWTLSHLVIQSASAEQVEMEMGHKLATIWAAVYSYSIAVGGDAFFLSNFFSYQQ